MHAHGGAVAADANQCGLSARSCGFWLLSRGFNVFAEAHGHHGYTLAALGWSICATGAGAASHVKAPARLVAQHQNPAKLRTVLWHYIESRLFAIQRGI
jgi:hypothetical protein